MENGDFPKAQHGFTISSTPVAWQGRREIIFISSSSAAARSPCNTGCYGAAIHMGSGIAFLHLPARCSHLRGALAAARQQPHHCLGEEGRNCLVCNRAGKGRQDEPINPPCTRVITSSIVDLLWGLERLLVGKLSVPRLPACSALLTSAPRG